MSLQIIIILDKKLPEITMSSKLQKRFNALVLIVLFSINCWIYIHRDNGYAYTSYLNQNQLYTISENPHITGFTIKGRDSLEIKLTPNSTNWQSINGLTKTKSHPIIELREGKHLYKLYYNTDTIFLGFDFVSSTTYKKNGRTRGSVIELCYSSVPTNNEELNSISHWQQISPFTTEKEINEGKQLLKDSLHIKQTDKDIDKIEKISTYILRHLDSNKGIPIDKMDEVSPTQKFKLVKTKQSKIWCGNFADIFSFYANCMGINTRLVCLEGKIGDIYKAGHSFNEAYIKELKQWVFIDLTSNTIFAKTSSNHYLNSIEFYNLYQLAPKEITTIRFINDSIQCENFEIVKSFYDDYFQSNNQFVFYNRHQFENNTYSLFSKFKRYIFKNPTFTIFTEASIINNEKFYIKQFALFALFSFLTYLLISSLILKRKQ